MGPFWGFHAVSMFSVDFFMVTGFFPMSLVCCSAREPKASLRAALEPAGMWLIPSAGMVVVTLLPGPTVTAVRNGQGGQQLPCDL